jgi:hypothetical protein
MTSGLRTRRELGFAEMESSDSLKATVLVFYDRFTANDVSQFDDLVSDEATLFIGTDDDEWFTDREKLRSGFGWRGLQLYAGDPKAWEHGDVGWVADRPTMRAAGVGELHTRFSGVFRREDDRWKLLMSHFSVGVPDAEAADLQARSRKNLR